MSGQPNRYANSAEMFRNKYMEALNNRANVDDFNLQANKNFKATGSLPPNVKAMVDNRTTTEILADSEKLKLNIISELKPVMNMSTASVVVQKIQTAPANADGSFLVWTAQNIQEIVKNLKKKYAIGIKGDQKDATNIVIYLSDMYSKIKDYSGTVKSYFDTYGEVKGGMKEGDLDSLRKEYEVIVARIKSRYPNYRQPSERKFNEWIIKTSERIQNLYRYLSSERYKTIIEKLQSVNSPIQLSQVNGYNEIGKAMFELNDSLPSSSLVRALYSQLDKSLENKSKDLTLKIIEEIHDLFPPVERIRKIESAFITLGPDDPHDDYFKPIKPPKTDEDGNIIPPKEFNDFKTDRSVKSRVELEEQLIMIRDDIIATNKMMKKIDKSIKESSRYYQILKANNDPGASDVWDKLTADKDTYDDLNKYIQELWIHEQEVKKQLRLYDTGKYQNEDQGDEFIDAESGPEPGDPSQGFLGKRNDARATARGKKLQENKQRLLTSKAKYQNTLHTENLTPERQQVILDLIDKIDDEIATINAELVSLDMLNDGTQSGSPIQALQDEINQLEQAFKREPNPETRAIMQGEINEKRKKLNELNSSSGSGLKRRRGRPKGSGISFKDNIDHAKGIQPVKKYHPFGKYFVNSHKLNNGNVLSIKSKSGTNVREYPSRTVSPHLGHVIKTIIGGGVPSWNDMEKLTEDEKDYLYKVSKRAEFSDKITIPTPSKDQQEKDIHEFEVCKGEIMAGNDSKELIKKFKLLIIKLSKNGTIPKREASEVMTELLELGY